MNFEENVIQFEKLLRRAEANPHDMEISSLLNLPFNDVRLNMKYLLKPFLAVSEILGATLSRVHENYKDDVFENLIDFTFIQSAINRYNSNNPLESSVRYLKNISQQWQDIARDNDVDVMDISNSITHLINSYKEKLEPFEKSIKFLADYQIIQTYYKENQYDVDVTEFYINEFKLMCQNNLNIVNDETIKSILSFDDSYMELKEILDNIDSHIVNIQQILKQQAPQAIASIADNFLMSQTPDATDVTSFLCRKNFDGHILNQITLTKSQTIVEMISFSDRTVVWKDRDDNYHKIHDNDQLRQKVEQLVESAIDYTLRKKPKVAKFFSNKYIEDGGTGFKEVNIVIDTYLQYEDILKNAKFNIDLFKYKSFEDLNDAMHASIQDYKIERYANSIVSNKYKHLITQDTLVYFKTLYDENISESKLQEMLGKKLAAMKTPEDFFVHLKDVMNKLNGFNEEALFIKLKDHKIEPSYQENGVIVFEVKTFEESKSLGSSSWCIARDDYYFAQYTHDARQFFLYDFKKMNTDNQSMIGFTINTQGEFTAQHLKNDDHFNVNGLLTDVRKHLIINDVDNYRLSDEMKASLGIDKEQKSQTKNHNIKVGLQ